MLTDGYQGDYHILLTQRTVFLAQKPFVDTALMEAVTALEIPAGYKGIGYNKGGVVSCQSITTLTVIAIAIALVAG